MSTGWDDLRVFLTLSREGNLTALRELALRRTAAGVEERLTDYMREHQIEEVWPAAERVVVLVGVCSLSLAIYAFFAYADVRQMAEDQA